MALYFISLFLFIHPQEKSRSFDDAIKKLGNKTWIVYKECLNDSCSVINDNNYYLFHDAARSYNNSDDTVYAGYSHYIDHRNDSTTGGFSYATAGTMICFYKGRTNKKDAYPIFIQGENYRGTGELLFADDTHFILNTTSLSEDSTIEKRQEFYKLVPTPQEILDVEK